ncbi:MAG TPA: hypothetical protein VJZ26_05795 [Blastocatellia bacterium]|nr:hypothetical protein [Blastocatellia bacterium]
MSTPQSEFVRTTQSRSTSNAKPRRRRPAKSHLRAFLTVSFLVLTLLAGPSLGLAQKSKRNNATAASGEKAPALPQKAAPQAQAINQPAARSISLSEINSGVAPDGKGKLWAVVIGVSNYKNLRPEEQLRFAHRDAEELAAFLRSPNGGGFPSTQIKVLLNEEATIA